MKKSWIKLLLLLSVFLIYNACENYIVDKKEGTLIVNTPSLSLTKLVSGLPVEELITDGDIRYEIAVESENKRINSVILKNNESTSLKVPAGVKLTVAVGIYVVEKESEKELINAYLVSDVKNNVVVMPDQTIYLDFTIDLDKPTSITYHYPHENYPAPGISDITGITFYTQTTSSGYQYPLLLTQKNLITADFKLLGFYSSNFHNLSIPSEGKLFKINIIPGLGPYNYEFWYITNNDIFYNSGNDLIDVSPFSITSKNLSFKNESYRGLLTSIERIETVKYPNVYYYSLIYKNGVLVTKYDSIKREWSEISKIDFSHVVFYPELPFILDVTKGEVTDTFFASQIGLFYVDSITFDYFAAEEYTKGVNRLKKIIKITDPYDKRKSVLVTSVEVVGNKIFLGTRLGLYKINLNSSKWISFESKEIGKDFIYLDESIIEQVKVLGNTPINMLTSYEDILIIATPNALIFFNTQTEKTKVFTVWDGLPFIPERKLIVKPSYNNKDYYIHGISPIKNVLYDENLNTFWIATMHGLASIERSKIF